MTQEWTQNAAQQLLKQHPSEFEQIRESQFGHTVHVKSSSNVGISGITKVHFWHEAIGNKSFGPHVARIEYNADVRRPALFIRPDGTLIVDNGPSKKGTQRYVLVTSEQITRHKIVSSIISILKEHAPK